MSICVNNTIIEEQWVKEMRLATIIVIDLVLLIYFFRCISLAIKIVKERRKRSITLPDSDPITVNV
jgi:hypothetical protein